MIKPLIFLLVFSNAQETCFVDSDCLELSSCHEGLCEHKELFPLAVSEIIGIFVMIVVSALANAGGAGGSSMTLSLMLLLHKFDPHSSVALTQVFMFAGTCTVTILKMRDRHPTRDRPLIYYDVLMQIVSPILIGVSVGVTLNPAFPGWLILALLTLVVIFLVYDILKRSVKIYRKEKADQQVIPSQNLDEKSQGSGEVSSGITNKARENDGKLNICSEIGGVKGKEDGNRSNEASVRPGGFDGEEDRENGVNMVQGLQGVPPARSFSDVDEHAAHPPETESSSELLRKLTTIYQEEKKIIAWVPFFYFILLAGASIAFPLIKGSSSTQSFVGIKSCSAGYFGVTVAYLVFMILMNILSSVYLVRKTFVCESTNYVFDEGDIHWTYKKCAYVSGCSVVAGLVVGLLGMGGGNLIGPMLLALGVRPEISTISSSFTIFISSGTAAAQYFITGKIDPQYSAWFFMLSIIGSLIGILVLRKIAIQRQRVSVLIFCLFFILSASLVIIPTVGVLNAVKQSQEGTFQLGFKQLC
jgi:uncharacterized membrane protein YfcA